MIMNQDKIQFLTKLYIQNRLYGGDLDLQKRIKLEENNLDSQELMLARLAAGKY